MTHVPFSGSSEDYRKFRPLYPEKLFRYLAGTCRRRETAWDVACGNGQVAQGLASYFKLIYATDVSVDQIQNAFPLDNVQYALAREKYSKLKKRSIDLVCVAQAIHYLDLDVFYKELFRVLKKFGVYVCWSYRIPRINHKLDDLVRDFHHELLVFSGEMGKRGLKWNFHMHSFPFRKIVTPSFEIRIRWSFTQFLGYLRTWTIYRSYCEQKKIDPLEKRIESLSEAWKTYHKDCMVVFPIDMTMGILT